MVQIQNTDAITAIRNGAKLSISEGFPQNLMPNAQAVLDMTPRFHRIAKVLGGGATTLFTASSSRDTYITGIQMSISKTAADTGAYYRVSCVIDSATVIIAYIVGTTGQLDNQTSNIHFTVPIKVDRGTAVTAAISGTYDNKYCIVYGYEVEAQV